MDVHLPQAMKQTYGYRCGACGEIWDGYQVPCPIDVALRAMESNRTCFSCGSPNVFSVMPRRYEELKREAASLPGSTLSDGLDKPQSTVGGQK